MSGLEDFFRDFLKGEDLPSFDDETMDASDTKIAADSENRQMEYSQPWTLKQWYAAQALSMANYLNRRVIVDKDCPDDSDQEFEDYKSEDNLYGSDNEDDSEKDESEDFDMFLHTQESAVSGLALEKPRQRQRRIPHLNQTLHHVQQIEYLDMFTSQFDLKCCQITKLCRLRNTMRHKSKSTSRERCPILPGRLPRIPFPHRQEDGPLLSMYKDVVQLELTNLSQHRIYVFLYRQYARLFDQWYQKELSKHGSSSDNNNSKSKTKFWIQLNRIPGICILPFAIDLQNVADTRQLVKYCICIGDESKFQIDSKFLSNSNTKTKDTTYEGEETTTATSSKRSRRRGSSGSLHNSPEPMSLDTAFNTTISGNDGNGPGPLRMDNDDLELRFLCAFEKRGTTPLKHSCSPELILSQASLTDPSAREQDEGDLMAEWRRYPVGDLSRSNFTTTSITERLSATRKNDYSRPRSQKRQRKEVGPDERRGTVHSRNVAMPATVADTTLGTIIYEGSAKKQDKSEDVPDSISLCELRQALKAQPENTNFLYRTFGAVTGFTSGKQTKRGDWMMLVTLVDENSNEKPTLLMIFCKSRADFPQLSQAGDILHLQNVYLEEWNGDIQITGRKDQSSYVVVRNSEGDDWKVIPTARTEFFFDEDDEKKSQQLWHWAQQFLREHSMIQQVRSFSLQQMAALPQSHNAHDKDMTVMVSGIYQFPTEKQDGRMPCGLLRIWDGTGPSASDPLPMQLISARHVQRHGDPPPEAMKKIAGIIDTLLAFNGRQECGHLQPPKALCGKVANAIIWEESYWEMIQKNVTVGSFVRLRNVQVQSWNYNNTISVMVNNMSWLTPIPDESFEVGSLLREHDKRVQRNEYNPNSGIMPTTFVGNNRRFDPLGKGLEAFASNPSISSFVGLVHLGATYPKYENDLQPFCKLSSDGSSFVYQFATTLCDRFGMIDVIVNNVAGETIIGMPASLAVGLSRRKNDKVIDPKAKWMVKVMRVTLEEVEYFVLVEISHT